MYETESTAMDLREIPVLESRSLRKGSRVVVGVIDAGTLVQRHFVPRRNTRTKEGYQRDLSAARVNRLEKDLRLGRVDLPTSVLLSMRDADSESLRETESGLRLRLDGHDLFVVDGQHRIESLSKLMEADKDAWADFLIPFVCVIGASEVEEMEQFYVVNSTAKSVRTDLAYDLLKQRAETDPEVVIALAERGETWKVSGQAIVEHLDKESSVWRGRIRFPGEAKGATTISSSGMVNSLKQLLSSPYFSALSTVNQVKVLDAYWQGIRTVMPECFDSPTEFTLQKTTGVIAIHSLLLIVLEHVRTAGDSVIDGQSYRSVLASPLTQLQGDNREGEPVSGVEFWMVGPLGAAGSFSSNAGRRVLLAKIRNLLPKLEVE